MNYGIKAVICKSHRRLILKDKNLSESKYELLVHMNNDISCQNKECEKLVIIKTKTPNAKKILC